MRLTVIEGGLTLDAERIAVAPSRAAVQAEVARRIRASGYERAHARSVATGVAVPRALEYLRTQIAFVGETLLALDPIPEDYSDDKYWPT